MAARCTSASSPTAISCRTSTRSPLRRSPSSTCSTGPSAATPPAAHRAEPAAIRRQLVRTGHADGPRGRRCSPRGGSSVRRVTRGQAFDLAVFAFGVAATLWFALPWFTAPAHVTPAYVVVALSVVLLAQFPL